MTMTNAQRVAEARDQLKAAMQRLPFDLQSAGATRIMAWKQAHAEAQKVLNRHSSNPDAYHEARRAIESCAGSSVEQLAVQAFGSSIDKIQFAARAGGAA